MFSLLLLYSLSTCDTMVYEKKGALAYWRPQVWLTNQEEEVLDNIMYRKQRCMSKVFVNRQTNHVSVHWKKK